MGDTRPDDDNTWGRYLYRLTRRPGWTITRLSDQSGISRQAISDWINKGKASSAGLKIETVMAIVQGAGSDPVEALRAAAGIQDDDPEISRVRALNLRPTVETEVIKEILELRIRDQDRRMQDTERIIRYAEGRNATA